MSAICGLVGSLAVESAAQERLDAMLEALGRRAPGNREHCHAGEARLAARCGPSGGGNVVSAAQQRYRAVGDGTVFNKAEINEYLRSRGIQVASQDSTELLLQLFVTNGLDAFKRVDGQFAIAIWDGLQQQLYLGRDFLGVVPLYYMAGEH